MKLLRILTTIFCIVGASAANAGEEPTAKTEGEAKRASEATTVTAKNVNLINSKNRRIIRISEQIPCVLSER